MQSALTGLKELALLMDAPTTPEERARFRELGFVRVDGLKPILFGGGRAEAIYAREADRGRTGSNNGTLVAVSMSGEVWIRTTRISEDDMRSLQNFLSEVCPRLGTPWVPCSNGEKIDFYDLMNRHADPDWKPKQ